MAKKGSYIKLHRCILDSAVFDDAEVLRLWIYILCNANYEDKDCIINGKVFHLKRGQMPAGRQKIALALGINDSKVQRSLKILENLGCITKEVNSKFSVITIENYGKFQGDSEKVNSKTTANTSAKQQQSEQQNNTPKEINNNINNNINISPYNPPLQGDDENAEKNAYGEYGNVLLTEDEFGKLAVSFPGTYLDGIKTLDERMELSERNKNRYGQMNHYLLIKIELEKVDKASRTCGYVPVDDDRLSFDLEDIFVKPC
jgi:predicted transcriptional regulator